MDRKLTVLLAGGVLLAALAGIWWQFRPKETPLNRAPLTGVGAMLVDETVRALQDRGRIVVIVPAAPGAAQHFLPPNGLWEGFQMELKKHPGLNLVATEFGVIDMAGCSSTAFREIWQRHTDADAILCFTGLPIWNDVSNFIQQKPAPKLIVADLDTPIAKSRYREYFDSGALHVLIGRRTQPVPSIVPETPRDWFQTLYQIYTPENFELIPN